MPTFPERVASGRAWAIARHGLAVTIVVASLAIRVIHRGYYYPGWDVLGAAKGLHTVSTETARQYLLDYAAYRTQGSVPWNVIGFPVAIVPGFLASVYPWEFWPHVVTFALFLTCLGLLWRAIGLSSQNRDLLLLGWASSSALLSFSVAGFPYISNTLPFALALWVVLKPRTFVSAMVFSAVALELSWHVQELGRTVFVVFVSAALLLPGLGVTTRVVFGMAGTLGALLATRFHSFNTARYAAMSVPGVSDGLWSLVALGDRFVRQKPDLFVLVPLAVVAVAFTGKRRWFWMATTTAPTRTSRSPAASYTKWWRTCSRTPPSQSKPSIR